MIRMNVLSPSTIPYKERLELKAENMSAYAGLYVNAYAPTVWQRLFSDASVRQDRVQSARQYKEGATAGHGTWRLSGYSTNTSKAVYSLTSFKTGHDETLTPPIEDLHPMTVRSFQQKHPVDYKAAIRPDCQTTNQTQRMMGTYSTDKAHAKRSNLHIPHMSPVKEGLYFHPDVRISDLAVTRATKAAEPYAGGRSASTGRLARPWSAPAARGQSQAASPSLLQQQHLQQAPAAAGSSGSRPASAAPRRGMQEGPGGAPSFSFRPAPQQAWGSEGPSTPRTPQAQQQAPAGGASTPPQQQQQRASSAARPQSAHVFSPNGRVHGVFAPMGAEEMQQSGRSGSMGRGVRWSPSSGGYH